MLTEFGGIALAVANTWGYAVSDDAEDFARHYERLLDVVRQLALFSGFCYTQFADTYQEANGLLHADRTPKIPLRRIAAATAGPVAARTDGIEQVQAVEGCLETLMDKRVLTKPDGRRSSCTARALIGSVRGAEPQRGAAHRPTRICAGIRCAPNGSPMPTHRQHRTFLPPGRIQPAWVSDRGTDHPTEVPPGPWDVAVFENLFPAFAMTAHDPPSLAVPTAPGSGVCEVVVFTQDPTATLGSLPLWHIELVVDVWADRYEELGRCRRSRTSIRSKIAASRSASRCTIRTARSTPIRSCRPCRRGHWSSSASTTTQHGRGLVEDMVAREVAETTRMIYAGPHVAAFMPICARYSYEVWIAPHRRVAFVCGA